MKTYSQLTPAQRTVAQDRCLSLLLQSLLEGCPVRYFTEDPAGLLQQRIDSACQKADDMQTPWFAHEYILDTCRPELSGIAKQRAKSALYPEPGEDVIEGVIR